MSGLLSSTVAGLRSVQRALDTTGHNISNANTPGYSRQSAVISTQQPSFAGVGYVGNGSYVQTIRRHYDGFVENQLRSAIAENSQLQYMQKFTSQVSELAGDLDHGVSQQLRAFYNAAEDVASNPTDITARQAYLGAMESMTYQLNTLDRQLQSLELELGKEVQAIGNKINAHANEIAALNVQISEAHYRDPNAMPNDLLDRRDLLIRELSEEVDMRVQEQGDASISLYVGTGQPLVLGGSAFELDASRSPAGVSIKSGGLEISSLIKGGNLGGIIEAQDSVVTPLRNELGRVALVFSDMVNSVQEDGVDLDGAAGVPLLNDLASMTGNALALPSNKGTGSAEFVYTDVLALTGETYAARWNDTDGAWDVYASNSPRTVLEQVPAGGTSTSIPGVEVTFAGTGERGDSLSIRPGEGMASRLSVEEVDPRLVAAAGAGEPAGSRDNSNMKALLAEGESRGIGGIVEGAVARVGSLASQVRLRAEAAEMTVTSLNNKRESVSGVNLDEEAANLMRFQQAYQALAQTMAVQDTIFQSVLNAMR